MSDTYTFAFIYKGRNRGKKAMVGHLCWVFCREKERERLLSTVLHLLCAVQRRKVRSLMLLCILACIDTHICGCLWFS